LPITFAYNWSRLHLHRGGSGHVENHCVEGAAWVTETWREIDELMTGNPDDSIKNGLM